MEMPGGGTFPTYPGQVTDDSEMALHLLKALHKFDIEKTMEENLIPISLEIGLEYVKWAKSGPFDIGNTCNGGINNLYMYDLTKGAEKLEEAFK